MEGRSKKSEVKKSEVLAEGDVFVQVEGKECGQSDGDRFGNQGVPMAEIDAEIEDQRIQQQTDDLNHIEYPKAKKGLVLLSEVDVSVQEEAA